MRYLPLLAFLIGATSLSAADATMVTLSKTGADGFQLTRNGKPYWVNGIGGSVRLDLAGTLGANSVRTWGTEKLASIVPDAKKNGLTVMVGFWLSHNGGDYTNAGYRKRMTTEVERVVGMYAKDPTILAWAIGNETNAGADTPDAWKFIGELAALCKKLDPQRPVTTVLAHPGTRTLDNLATLAPAIDMVGVNSYGGLDNWPRNLSSSKFKGPFMVTEWGPDGHWEVPKTSWGAPIEQTSSEKAEMYGKRLKFIESQKPRCLGSYVFLWGQKQERTPTWYSMFTETVPALSLTGQSYGTVDAMGLGWSGKPLKDQAPLLEPLRATGITGEAKITSGTLLKVSAQASDPDKDKLTYSWEVMAEATQLGNGGSHEGRPASVADAIQGSGPSINVTVAKPGNYRLFVYVTDTHGKAATANLPFQVN